MQQKRWSAKKGFHKTFIILFIVLQFMPSAFAQTLGGEAESGVQNTMQNEIDSDLITTEQGGDAEIDVVPSTAAQTEIDNYEAAIIPAASSEIEVSTQYDLQKALNEDGAIIKIIPQSGKDYIALDGALRVLSSRTVTITADEPVSINGARGQWTIITNPNTDVTIRFINVTLDGGNAAGGIYNQGTLTLENASIKNCNHPNSGSGVYSVGSLTIRDSVFTNNVAEPDSYLFGGGFYARGLSSRITVNITNSEFTGNSAKYGGAMRIDNADANVINCNFSENTAAQGACIYIAGAELNVTGSTLTNNTGSGGAIFVNVATAVIADSSICDNNGRGIYGYTEGGDVEITVQGNTTVIGNSAKTSYGGGIIGYTWGDGKAIINIKDNVIISDNIAMYGGGVSGFHESNVFINLSGNPQIIKNIAYEKGGGIYGAAGNYINIDSAVLSDNTAGQDGGGIWIAKLAELTVNNSVFRDNSSQSGYMWDTDSPSDDKQSAGAVVHRKRIFNTSYTQPFTNAYNDYDINYTTADVSELYTVTYAGNGNSGGSPPVDKDGPRLAGEDVALSLSDSLVKAGYSFTGWNTETDGVGINYAYDEKLSLFSPQAFIMEDENITLYAQWQKKTGHNFDTASGLIRFRFRSHINSTK